MSSFTFPEFSNDQKWKQFFKENPLLMRIVSLFVHGETLSHGYVYDTLNGGYDLFVEGELLTDEGMDDIMQKLNGLTNLNISKLKKKKFEKKTQQLVSKTFGSLLNQYLKGFALTENIVDSNNIELHVFVTSPSLRKQGIGRKLMTRIKSQLKDGGCVMANASDCQNKDQFGSFFL